MRDNGADELGLDGVYSHSQISNFLACEQAYAYKYRDGWRSPRSSRAMTLGTVGHHLLDEWWVGKDITDFDLEAITEYVVSLNETPSIEECESIADHALWLLRRYDRMYANDRERVTVLEVEQFRTFELPQLGERRFGLICKIDKLMESPAHGGIVFMDHKFVGKRDKAETLDRDPQFSLYFLALRETGVDINLALLDSIYTYRNKKKGEFVEWDAINVEESFSRIPTDRTKEALDFVAREAYRACERMWHLRQDHYQPLLNVGFACQNCEFSAPCFERVQGLPNSELAMLKELFDPSRPRPTPMRNYLPDSVEIW